MKWTTTPRVTTPFHEMNGTMVANTKSTVDLSTKWTDPTIVNLYKSTKWTDPTKGQNQSTKRTDPTKVKLIQSRLQLGSNLIQMIGSDGWSKSYSVWLID